jgi:competence protein ComEA
MGLQERDYIRDRARQDQENQARMTTRGKAILAALAVIAIAGVAFWYSERPPGNKALVVNVNTATQQEIETLPGIDGEKAALIIAGRPYVTVDDLVRVYGIGPKTIERLRPFVKVEGETEKRE